MSRNPLYLIGGALAGLVLAVSLLAAFSGPSGDYPDPPFYPLPREYPRLIPVRDEPPQSDPAAWAEYWQERGLAYYTKTAYGAIRSASEDERQAVVAAYEGKYVQARELANKALIANQNSIPGLYALAQVEAKGESNLPYALFLIRKARGLVERQGRRSPANMEACEWYVRTLEQEMDILEQMDLRHEQLRVIELLGEVYEPMPWLRIWPLIKLRRYDDARRAVVESLADGRRPSIAYNGLCALEDKLGRRQECLEASRQMVEAIEGSPVLWGNYGLAACNAFEFDEAERAFLTSAQMGTPDFFGSSYTSLAFLYIQQGRFPEAIDALKRAQGQRAKRPIYSLQQDQAKTEMTSAALMLALGRARDAERFARKATHAPDRAGATSIDEQDLTLTGELLLWNVLIARREQLREVAGAKEDSALAQASQRRALDVEIWRLERRLRKQLVGEYLVNMARPDVPGMPGFETGVPSWLRGSIARIVPPGVAAEAIRRARKVDDLPQAAVYLDAIDAEASLALGDKSRALEMADAALARLPEQGERLLRARLEAIAGEALYRQGRVEEAMQRWDGVLRSFPHLFRLLQIALPMEIHHDGTSAAEKMADALRDSPRVRPTPGGFLARIGSTERRLEFEFFRLGQSRHIEDYVTPRSKAGEESLPVADELAALGVAALHDRLAQPRLDLSQADINSLDGSPVAAEFRGRIDDLLGPPAPAPEPSP